MRALLISDLHLHAEQPETQHCAIAFLHRECANASSLYILGDLFEAWVGDDDPTPWAEPFITALRAVSDDGTAVYLMHGNRDFLLGADFAERVNATLLTEDHHVIDVAGTRALIMHGDTLCTDDTAYQSVRHKVRSPAWQSEFLAQSLELRQEKAAAMRAESRVATSALNLDVTDANRVACENALDQSGAPTLIHGHTHRPGTHACGQGTRIVLGEWLPNGAEYAEITEHGARLKRWTTP